MTRPRKAKAPSMQRRRFLQQGALAGAAALVAPGGTADAQAPATAAGAPAPAVTVGAEIAAPLDVQVLGDNERSGSDVMVDAIKALGFEYVCANPGSSFRGLHESLINYGGNRAPELITCMH